MNLKDKVVVVTGGTGGMGLTVVKTLAAEGAKVAVTYRSEKKLAAAREAFAGLENVKYFPMDADDISSMAPCVDAIVADMGPIDGLVQLAGVMAGSPGLELTPEDWDKVMSANARGTFFFMQTVVARSMKEHGGSIVNMSSMAGIRGMVAPLTSPHYCASKAAVIAITKQAAVEWAELGIRANAIAPGGVKVGHMAGWKKEEIPPFLVANVPSKDLVEPECIAGTIVYLLSDASSAMSGQVVVLDGAATAAGY